MAIKTDRRDARDIAQLRGMGWFRPVHRKSVPSQEVRALLAARKQMQIKRWIWSRRCAGCCAALE
jgi:transposase